MPFGKQNRGVYKTERKRKVKLKKTTKKILAILLCATMLVLCVGGVVAYADFGSGVAVLAEGTEIVKSAISGKKIVFSDLDFKKGLCISDFEKIEKIGRAHV